MAESPARSITLGVDQFEVIFQVTHQTVNLQESRPMEIGFTAAELQKLIDALRNVDAHVADASRVCIQLGGDEAEAPAGLRVLAGEADGAGASRSEVTAGIPSRIVKQWHALVQPIVSALGSRELFLRAGFGPDEVEAAVVGLDFDW
ncbi:hypothetical protein [Streptomyces sp. YIM 130001]|uniref:hypothetical protein n=1 Tax=Streptomyces sp. YIM 130001 TaxID=2259644 RepID=UPI0013C45C60|nr:hypothetical protein [Streptomyces sp. YIM 130001]